MTGREIAAKFEDIAPLESGVPGDELGFVWGDPDVTIRAVGCMWCVHTPSIERAAGEGVNFIICHERLWLPPQHSPWYDSPDDHDLHAQRVRSALLDRYRMTVYRSHSNWDRLKRHGIADSAVASLGISGLREVARRDFYSIHELPEPWTVVRLSGRVGEALGFGGCRVFGDRNKPVRRIAFLIGGFGENQLHMPQAAMNDGAEALIIGEMSEFIVIACLEMGLPVVESLHSASEIPGIRAQATLLADLLPEVRVVYIPSGALDECTIIEPTERP